MEINRLEKRAAAPDFWDDQTVAQQILQRRRRLQEDFDLSESLRQRSEDLEVLVDWASQGESVGDDLAQRVVTVASAVEQGGSVAGANRRVFLSGARRTNRRAG